MFKAFVVLCGIISLPVLISGKHLASAVPVLGIYRLIFQAFGWPLHHCDGLLTVGGLVMYTKTTSTSSL